VAYLLNLAYLALLALAAPLLVFRAVAKGKYRDGWGAKFLGLAPRREDDAFCVWLHAVSVGEVNLLKPLVERIARMRPDWQVVISTTTRTGYALAKQKYDRHTVFYCPLDFSWAVRAAMRRVRPDLLLLAELELWPNLIRAAREFGARVGIVNGRLSQRSFRGYRRLRWLTAAMLRQIDLVAVQNEEYAERFLQLGARPETVHVTGSMKFDDVQTDRRNPATAWLRQLAGIAEGDVVFLVGSTHAPEEKIAVKIFRQLSKQYPQLRLVLVPRHAERFEEVARLLKRSGLPWQRRSELAPKRGMTLELSNRATSKRPASRHLGASLRDSPSRLGETQPRAATQPARDPGPRILLIDTIGELSAWWGTADVAFVGGSLNRRGGQNMIEPAAYGAAVSFGPNTKNFRDIVAALLGHKAAVVVKNRRQLAGFVRRCLQRPRFAEQLGRRAQSFVARQQGATETTLKLLTRLSAQNRPQAVRRAA
jgi:3-deoxy-D-manno-octulosonic-acid transferase